MKCSRCQAASSASMESSELTKFSDDVKIKIFRCKLCNSCSGLEFRGLAVSTEDILVRDATLNGWLQAETDLDKVVHYTLSQILYKEHEPPNENELEVVFDVPDPLDVIKILWIDGKAVGFYTVKPKGTTIEETFQVYCMATLDTAYIRKQFRRQGHCTRMITDLLQSYPEQDIGFSSPISNSMKKVLKKYLTQQPELQNRFWEIEGAGEEGQRKLIWYSILKETNRKRKHT
ncbi:protein FAM169B [Anabrus simplex]|uniref:protein FAM169B n=1 Tax=Anabrus simplex TaxID=316456 RepID=UPI0034DD087A